MLVPLVLIRDGADRRKSPPLPSAETRAVERQGPTLWTEAMNFPSFRSIVPAYFERPRCSSNARCGGPARLFRISKGVVIINNTPDPRVLSNHQGSCARSATVQIHQDEKVDGLQGRRIGDRHGAHRGRCREIIGDIDADYVVQRMD